MEANSPSAVRKAREASLQVKGARMFNLILRVLGDKKGVTYTLSSLDLMHGSPQYQTSPPALEGS